jgi:copper chaperone
MAQEGAVMTIELTLPDMTCGHCVKTVTQTAQRLDPQARVRTDLATHQAVFETEVARELLEKALAVEGYPAAASR